MNLELLTSFGKCSVATCSDTGWFTPYVLVFILEEVFCFVLTQPEIHALNIISVCVYKINAKYHWMRDLKCKQSFQVTI